MADDDVVRRINELADEEHRLHDLHEGGPASEDDRARLKEIELALDQCWDLLRQRRARREAGEDPAGAEVRSETVVENYLQ
jgi:hypothetical protein